MYLDTLQIEYVKTTKFYFLYKIHTNNVLVLYISEA